MASATNAQRIIMARETISKAEETKRKNEEKLSRDVEAIKVRRKGKVPDQYLELLSAGYGEYHKDVDGWPINIPKQPLGYD